MKKSSVAIFFFFFFCFSFFLFGEKERGREGRRRRGEGQRTMEPVFFIRCEICQSYECWVDDFVIKLSPVEIK